MPARAVSPLTRRLAAIPSRFKFEENIGQNPPLPRSDYYRAQHMLDALWSQVGPKYFPNRPQPTFDPQITPGGKDPLYAGEKTPADWMGLAYPRDQLTPGHPWSNYMQGSLPQPGVYGLSKQIVANLAHPNYFPINTANPIPRTVEPGDPYLRGGRVDQMTDSMNIRDAAMIPIHEWAHQFQSGPTNASRYGVEGGAQAFAQRAAQQATAALKLPQAHEQQYIYPGQVGWVHKRWTPQRIMHGQFGNY